MVDFPKLPGNERAFAQDIALTGRLGENKFAWMVHNFVGAEGVGVVSTVATTISVVGLPQGYRGLWGEYWLFANNTSNTTIVFDMRGSIQPPGGALIDKLIDSVTALPSTTSLIKYTEKMLGIDNTLIIRNPAGAGTPGTLTFGFFML